MSVRSFILGITAVALLGVSVVHAATNLSTPLGALRSYAAAIHAQSVPHAMACVSSTGKREKAVVKSMVTMMVANEHLSKIAVARLGPPTSRGGKELASASSGYKAMQAKLKKAKVSIKGTEATVTMPAPKGTTAGKTGILYFKKVGTHWKIDGEKLFHLDAVKKIPTKELSQRLKMSDQMAGAFNAAADDIQTGKVKTWKQLHDDIYMKMMAVMHIGDMGGAPANNGGAGSGPAGGGMGH